MICCRSAVLVAKRLSGLSSCGFRSNLILSGCFGSGRGRRGLAGCRARSMRPPLVKGGRVRPPLPAPLLPPLAVPLPLAFPFSPPLALAVARFVYRSILRPSSRSFSCSASIRRRISASTSGLMPISALSLMVGSLAATLCATWGYFLESTALLGRCF